MATPLPKIFYGWYVVGATFVMLFAAFGVVYSFGAFFLALSIEFEASRASVSSVFSYAVFTLFVSGAASGMIADRTGPKWVMGFGVLATSTGLLAAASASELWQVSISFMLGVGLGVGFVYVPAISAVQRWFDRRRGLASGLAVTGIGAGTLVVPIVAGILLETYTWRSVFEFMAVMILVAGCVAIYFVEAEPSSRGLAPDGMPLAPDRANEERVNRLLAPMIQSRPFIQYYVASAVLSIPIFIPFVHLVPYAEDIGIQRAVAVSILGLIGLGSTAGRFIVGGLADRVGRRTSLILLLAGIALAYGIWLTSSGVIGLGCFAIWFGICYGGYVALSPALLADYFAGPKLSSVIGLQYTSSAIGSLIGPVLAGYLFDLNGNYVSALAVGAGCSVAAFCMVLTMPKQYQTP